MRELIEKYLNKTVNLSIENLKIEAIVLDIKMAYGKIRYLVKPVAGSGQQWVENIYS